MNFCLFQFTQNDGLRKYLFKTVGSQLVFCDPTDGFWGNGLRRYDPLNKSGPMAWPGKNFLGQILEDVRESLMKNPAYKDLLAEVTKEKDKNKRKLDAYYKHKPAPVGDVEKKKFKTVP